MLFTNARVFHDDNQFHDGTLAVSNGQFSEESSTEPIDLEGRWVIPGLIDIHFHGNSGVDFSDGSYESLVKIARFLLNNGITSFSPASMTLPEKDIEKSFLTAQRLKRERPAGAAYIRGITMEGPFFNIAKKGAQNPRYLVPPDYDFFTRLNQAADGLIKIACVAPELPGALEFIEKAAAVCTVSVAHTTATYDQAKAGFDAGIRHVTHLFNAMPPFAHREPGVIGAAAENKAVTAELITDGIHVHPSAIRAAFSLFGARRIVLVSDTMSACGMPDGEYMLGGQKVFVAGRLATLADGTIAGSATHLFDCLRTSLSCGIKPEDAIQAATANPARVIGAFDQVGSITTGKQADFVVCNPDWSIHRVYLAGQRVLLNA